MHPCSTQNLLLVAQVSKRQSLVNARLLAYDVPRVFTFEQRHSSNKFAVVNNRATANR
jgi:hypothetical protein